MASPYTGSATWASCQAGQPGAFERRRRCSGSCRMPLTTVTGVVGRRASGPGASSEHRRSPISRSATVAQLAARAGLDLDEALVSLWDAGIDQVNDPEDRVPSKLLRVAESALGLENPRRQTRIDYWLKRTGLTRDEFVEQLAVIGVSITPNVRTLPKGGLRRVRRRFDSVPVAKEKLAVRTDDCPPFKWVDIGVRRSLTFLTGDGLRGIHDALVADFALTEDPIFPPGVKSPNLVSSAVHRPQTSMGNEFKYPTVEMAAAALLHSVV